MTSTTQWSDFHARHGSVPNRSFVDPADLERERCGIKGLLCCLSSLVGGGVMLSNSTKSQRRAQRQAAAAAAASYGPPGHLRYSDEDEFGFSFSPPRAMPHKQQTQAKYVT
jgi:hypothetical protein